MTRFYYEMAWSGSDRAVFNIFDRKAPADRYENNRIAKVHSRDVAEFVVQKLNEERGNG